MSQLRRHAAPRGPRRRRGAGAFALPLWLLMLAPLAGCPVDAPGPDVEPPTPALADDDDATANDDDSALSSCDPALTLAPTESWVLPASGLATLTAAGGTGAWEFALSADGSGGQVHPEYGTYLPGPLTGVDDVVTLTDGGCVGSASATMHVVQGLDVSPRAVLAPPGTSFDVAVTGGSGEWSCSLQTDGTGASVTPECAYAGGSTQGIDVVRVEDLATDEAVDVRIELLSGATMEAAPPRIWIPVGGTYTLRLSGGSGYVSAATATGSSATYEAGVFTAVDAGPTVFDLVDEFTGQTATVKVWGVAALEGGFARAGDNHLSGDSASPGDLDGDGWADVVLGITEADFGDYNNGAVHVYAGREGGMAVEPVQTLIGAEYDDRFGDTVHVADVTGDGELDLLVGTWLNDSVGTNSGLVELFPGIAGGFFEPTASRSWSGDQSFDYFGAGLTTCDFNGDGYEDLAVGASVDEDRTVSNQANSQGAVWFFLGGPNGLPEVPDQKVYGSVPDGNGSWTYSSEVRLGSEVEAGDVNGDGLCDVVVGAWEFEPPGENGNDGAVFVYLGTNTGGSSAAVFGEPVAAWSATAPGSRDSYFGRELDVGDVNGDGLDDILVGQYRHNVSSLSSLRHGAARLYLGQPWAETPAADFAPADSAVWSYYGTQGYDAVGWEVRLREMTGDSAAELLVTGYNDEVPGAVSGTGVVAAFVGVPGGLPSEVPTAWFAGDLAGDYFGVRVEGLPDMDGDSLPDLFVYASRAEHHGTHVGTPYFQPSGLGASAVPLGNPGEAAGHRAGESVAVLGDVNGDGFEDVAVGVPRYENAGNEINAGLVQVFFGTATGVSDTAWELSGFQGYSEADEWGWRIAPAGDFDGDGIDDIAVLGRYEDRPSSFSSAFAPGAGCAGSMTNTGAIAVFRGTASGTPESQPAFIWYGHEASDTTRDVAGSLDIDGDGFSDLLAGGIDWDTGATNVGGFEILYGRPADPNGIVVLCNDGELFEGPEASGRLGRGLAGLGDIDNDGCDEAAVGAYEEDAGYSNQGVVRILWGFGAGCGATEPHVSLLVPQDSSARAGYSVAGGHDVDGDGVNDLLVGGYSRSTGGNSTGAAWLVPGWYLQSLPREPLTTQAPWSVTSPIAPPTGGPYTLEGSVQDEHFGRSVALVPRLGPGATAGVAVGAPRGDLPGVERVGGVRIHLWDPAVGGLDVRPWGVFGGESFTPNGRVGEALSAGSIGGLPVIAVGGFRAESWGPAQGAAWLVPLIP